MQWLINITMVYPQGNEVTEMLLQYSIKPQ